MSKPVVALAMPIRPGSVTFDPDAMARGVAAKATDGACDICPGQCATSLLPYTFNTLWAGFLGMRAEHGITHFAMIHDDIRPRQGWLDVLLAELESTGADVVSAVVPIKNVLGLTSTGVDTDPWNPRRLTLHECWELPETFTDADAGGELLLNTGLWVCRFDRDWCEKVCFRQTDRIVQLPSGEWAPQTQPEDWDFSRQVRALGGKLAATRKIVLEHERAEWHTRFPWGKWQTDRDMNAEPSVQAKRMGA